MTQERDGEYSKFIQKLFGDETLNEIENKHLERPRTNLTSEEFHDTRSGYLMNPQDPNLENIEGNAQSERTGTEQNKVTIDNQSEITTVHWRMNQETINRDYSWHKVKDLLQDKPQLKDMLP